MMLAWLIVASACVCVPAQAGPFSGLEKLFKSWGLFQGIQVSGNNNFTFQQNMIQGSSSAFEGQRWDTNPFMTQNSLSLEGPLWKEFSFKADFSTSGYGPSYNRWIMGYIGHDSAVYYGDLNIDLSGNQFAAFSKAVKGWQLDQKIGKGLARAFYSQEKSITRVQSIPGNNTSGPFFLTYTPVMQGTEVVKINEQIQQFGVDYRLDYDSGQLWFETEGRPPKIIPDTATIVVSYQSSALNNSSGTLYGGRVLMPMMGDRLQVGVTMLKQDRGGGGTNRDTVGYQEDIFNGSGSTGPFDVNFRPIIVNGSQVTYQGRQQTISQALLVLVDNVEWVEGVDFDSYRSIGRIIFRRGVPATSLVVIRYYYDLSNDTTAADNAIMGVDLLYHLTPKLNLQAEYGKSDGGLTTNSGDALRLNLDYQGDKFKFVGEYRDISPTFTFMDSSGFYRQDKGLDLGVNWQPAQHISVFARRSAVKTNQGYSFGYNNNSGYNSYGMQTQQTGTDTPSALDISSTRNDLELRLDYPNLPTFAWQFQQLANSGGTNGGSNYGSNNFSLNWSPSGKPYSLSATYYNTNQDYMGSGSTSTSQSTQTQQLQWAAQYRPSDKLSLSYNAGTNKSSITGSTTGSSSNTNQLSVRWTPSSKIDINYDRTQTRSVGSVASSGSYLSAYLYPNGIGDGGGIGGDGDPTTEENRYQDDNSRLSVRYSPSQKLSFDFSLSDRTYTSGGSVGYLADSSQSTRSISAMYQLNDSLSFNAQMNNDTMAFLEAGRGTVDNKTMSLGANWRQPSSPWSLALNFTKMDGVSPTYTGSGANQRMWMVQNKSADMQARLSYALSDFSSIDLTGQFSDYAGGYANFNKQQLEVGYRRKLSNMTDLTFGYRFVRNMSGIPPDPRWGNTSLTGGDQNYLANTFLLTVSTQFNSGIGGGSSMGMMGGSSLGNSGGYRAGSGAWGNEGSNYGSGYGGAFQNMGVFGQSGGAGTGFSSPFGNSGSSYGSNYGNNNGYGVNQSQGYDTFGPSYQSGQGGGFNSGLGDISGARNQGGGVSNLAPLPGAQPGQDDVTVEDWYTLDDMYSIWW